MTTSIDPVATGVLAVAAADWLSTVAHSLSQEQLELLHRALDAGDLEISIRVLFKTGSLILEVSDGVRKTDLARVEVEPLRPVDGFGPCVGGIQ